MTPRQTEIAGESYTACLLAQAGYDVLVQYGPNQPQYDLVAIKDSDILTISVKGSQDGGWALAISQKNKQNSYHQAIDNWLHGQRTDTVFFLIQFYQIKIGEPPRAYLASPIEISNQLKAQRNGQGYGRLVEDQKRDHPKSGYIDKIPDTWLFSLDRLNELATSIRER